MDKQSELPERSAVSAPDHSTGTAPQLFAGADIVKCSARLLDDHCAEYAVHLV